MYSWKWHAIPFAIFCWSRGPSQSSERKDYLRVWILGGRDHWEEMYDSSVFHDVPRGTMSLGAQEKDIAEHP